MFLILLLSLIFNMYVLFVLFEGEVRAEYATKYCLLPSRYLLFYFSLKTSTIFFKRLLSAESGTNK